MSWFSAVQSHNMLQSSEMQFKSSMFNEDLAKLFWTEMYDDWGHFRDPNFKRKGTTLGIMVDSGWFMILYFEEMNKRTFIDCEWQNAINSANLGDGKIDGHHFSAIDFPILTIVHGSWIRIGSRRRDYCIGPGCSIILFVQPFPQHLIKEG